MRICQVLLALPIALAACGQPAELADEPESASASAEFALGEFEIVLPAVEGRPAALYGSVQAGSGPDRLTAIRIDGADVEIHETVEDAGVMRMEERDGFDLMAGETLAMKRGGKHGMIFGLSDLEADRTVPVILVFENVGEQTVLATTRAPGSAKSGTGMDHDGMTGMKGEGDTKSD